MSGFILMKISEAVSIDDTKFSENLMVIFLFSSLLWRKDYKKHHWTNMPLKQQKVNFIPVNIISFEVKIYRK